MVSERPLIVGPDLPEHPFPVKLKGSVVKGFGRGSKELGIPTANYEQAVADRLSADVGTGIYYGWASVGTDSDEIYPMVMSVGWNPYYKNEKKSAVSFSNPNSKEVHIIHDFQRDFYNEEMRVLVLGFIRNEQNYPSLDALINDIKMDIQVSLHSLKRTGYQKYTQDKFFFSQ